MTGYDEVKITDPQRKRVAYVALGAILVRQNERFEFLGQILEGSWVLTSLKLRVIHPYNGGL